MSKDILCRSDQKTSGSTLREVRRWVFVLRGHDHYHGKEKGELRSA